MAKTSTILAQSTNQKAASSSISTTVSRGDEICLYFLGYIIHLVKATIGHTNSHLFYVTGSSQLHNSTSIPTSNNGNETLQNNTLSAPGTKLSFQQTVAA